MDNPYIRLTQEFNHGRLRAILASGQAVVLYRLAIMSKDGDWLVHGWSSHLEFQEGGLRLRCDFVTRPPRVSPASLRIAMPMPPRGGVRNGPACRRRLPACH